MITAITSSSFQFWRNSTGAASLYAEVPRRDAATVIATIYSPFFIFSMPFLAFYCSFFLISIESFYFPNFFCFISFFSELKSPLFLLIFFQLCLTLVCLLTCKNLFFKTRPGEVDDCQP
jgi:hypothetical protein